MDVEEKYISLGDGCAFVDAIWQPWSARWLVNDFG